MEDYVVQVGTGRCVPTSLYDSELKCQMPEELPEHDGSDFKLDGKDELPAVVVCRLFVFDLTDLNLCRDPAQCLECQTCVMGLKY